MSASSAFHDTFHRDTSGNYGGPGLKGRSSTPVHETPAKQAPLKLTRRGRIVFIGVPLVLLAALILSLSGFFNAPAKAAESAADLALTPAVSVTVQPGESLWAIAESVAPEQDPRDVVAAIVQLNNLDAARVVPGQALFIPSK